MISLILSVAFVTAVVAIMLRMLILANRAPAPVNLASGRYQGRDMDAFVKSWRRKAWLNKRQGQPLTQRQHRQQAEREGMA